MNLGWIFRSLFFLTLLSRICWAEVYINASDESIQKEIQDYANKTLTGDISPEHLSDFIRRIYFRWPIYTVSVLRPEDAQSQTYEVQIVLKKHIVSVDFIGNVAIRDKQLQEKLQLQAGDYILPGAIKRYETAIADYYALRGFHHTEVKVTLRDVDRSKSDFLVNIRENAPCRIRSFVFLGQSDPKWVNRRCDKERIDSWLNRRQSLWRNQSYLMSQLSEPSFKYSEDQNEADVEFLGHQGPRVKFDFLGNTFAFERDDLLKKSIYFEHEHEFSSSWLEFTAKEGIISFYRAKGYPEAKVDIKDEYNSAKTFRYIRFKVDRGPKIKFNPPTFVGQTHVSTKSLRNAFYEFSPPVLRDRTFVEDELKRMSTSLIGYLESKGYLHALVAEPEIKKAKHGKNMDVTYTITEGEATILRGVHFIGTPSFSPKDLLNEIDPPVNEPLDPQWIRSSYIKLENYYQSRGYKYAKIQVPNLSDISSGKVDIEFLIEEGPKVKIGEVSVVGNATTRNKIVTQELTFDKGDTYSPSDIRDSRRRLLQTGYYESVAIETIPTVTNPTQEDVVITIRERKKRSLVLRPGFSTDDGARAAAELRYLNIMGTGRDVSIAAKVNRRLQDSSVWERRLALTYVEPYIFEKVRFRTTVTDEVVDDQQFDLRRQSLQLALERLFSIKYRAILDWNLEFRDPFNIDPGAVLSPIDQSSARFGSIGTSIDIDFRDDLLNPMKGSIHRIQYDFYDHALLSQADFHQVYLRNTFYQPIYRRLRTVLALRVGFSATRGQTSDDGIEDIPIEKRFRLGGNNSFRGVQLNCIGGLPSNVPENCSDSVLSQAPGGNAVFNYMFELLIPLGKTFDLALFTDGGNAYQRNSDFNPLDIRNSAGAGLRLNTFFGPIRFDYGILLDRRTGEDFGAFHFSVGQF